MDDQLIVAVDGRDRLSGRGVTVVSVLSFAAVVMAGEMYAKWWPYAWKVSAILPAP